MRKEIVAMLVLGLMIPSALAIYGGETLNFTLSQCDNFQVFVYPCEGGEWSVEGCNETSACFWSSNCTDNYIVNMTPAQNSWGNFTIEIKYSYLTEGVPVKETVYYSGGGCLPSWECSEWSGCLKNGTQIRECVDVDGCSYKNQRFEEKNCTYVSEIIEEEEDEESEPVVNETQEPVIVILDEEENNLWWVYSLGVIGLVILLVVAWRLLRRKSPLADNSTAGTYNTENTNCL